MKGKMTHLADDWAIFVLECFGRCCLSEREWRWSGCLVAIIINFFLPGLHSEWPRWSTEGRERKSERMRPALSVSGEKVVSVRLLFVAISRLEGRKVADLLFDIERERGRRFTSPATRYLFIFLNELPLPLSAVVKISPFFLGVVRLFFFLQGKCQLSAIPASLCRRRRVHSTVSNCEELCVKKVKIDDLINIPYVRT
jgi:hypothetical protein